jgi:hypothetical protein
MSKNTNLSFLTDYITADITNGRIGINNASPTVAFDVSGATKISGVLTLTSTISNGTYTYTLPSATGTLTLTSALSSYLQLTGGTLTGALGGTSATFSSTVTAGGNLGSSSDYTALTVRNQANGDYYVGIDFASGTDSGTSSIRSYRTNSAVNYETALTFWTKSTGANPTIPTEKMRITSAGNVGIGTSSPSDKLQVGLDENCYISIANGGSTDVKSGLRFRVGGGGTVYSAMESAASSSGNGYLSFSTIGSSALAERMRITAAGNVGIGTSSPGSLLEVSGTITASKFTSAESVVASIGTTAVTIFNPGTGASGVWMVTAVVQGNGVQAGYAIVGMRSGSTLYILSSGVGGQMTFSISGSALQLSQNAGGTINTSVSVLKINQGG